MPVAVETTGTSPGKQQSEALATNLAVIPVAIESKPQHSSRRARSAKKTKRVRRAKTAKRVEPNTTGGHRQPPDLFAKVVDQATRVQEHAVDVAAQFSFAGIDVLQTATALLLAPTVLLGARAKPDEVKLLPWSPPSSLESWAAPLPSSVAA
jgi:hypothetical protein